MLLSDLSSPSAARHLSSVREFLPHHERRGRRPPLFDGVGYSHVGRRGVDVFSWRSRDEDGRWTREGAGWVGLVGLRRGGVRWNWEGGKKQSLKYQDTNTPDQPDGSWPGGQVCLYLELTWGSVWWAVPGADLGQSGELYLVTRGSPAVHFVWYQEQQHLSNWIVLIS